jgi:hypothetical protein
MPQRQNFFLRRNTLIKMSKEEKFTSIRFSLLGAGFLPGLARPEELKPL